MTGLTLPTATVGLLLFGSSVLPSYRSTVRQLVCRGGPELRIAPESDPSPRDQRSVAMALHYRRSTNPPGDGYRNLDPGSCSWNPAGDSRIPAEPGVVRFDVDRLGSTYVPNPQSYAVWMKSSEHFWTFYVDDATGFSNSHGAYLVTFRADEVAAADTAPKPPAGESVEAHLRCRGGAGLNLRRVATPAANVVRMVLRYPRAPAEAGSTGSGLAPGTCAWGRRKGLEPEPGRVAFRTAGNAQLERIRSGAPVDRSTTAAERWPDVHSIRVYLADPAHYWTFTVRVSDPDLALKHRAWKPKPGDVVVTPPAPAQDPTPPVAEPMPTGGAGGAETPGGGTFAGAYQPGKGTSLSTPGGSFAGRYTPGSSTELTDPRVVYDIRNVQVRTGLEGVAIQFEAAPDLTPSVLVSTTAPLGSAGEMRFDGQPFRLVVQGTPTGGTLWHYTAASTTPLARGTQYWFLAEAPEGPNSRRNQATGQFRTLAQRVKVGISEIYVVSDSDNESDGDLWFRVVSCPRVLDDDIVGAMQHPVEWSEGRHQVGRELESAPGVSVPDRFRLFVTGVDDDAWLLSAYGSSHPFWAWFFCGENHGDGSLEPRASSKAEWNAAVLDLDLTQYAGATSTQAFVRRSQPLRNGSTLMFEVRGYITVTRE